MSSGTIIYTGASLKGPSDNQTQITMDHHGIHNNKLYGLWVRNPLEVINDVDFVNAQYQMGKRLIFQHQICIIDTNLIEELKRYNINYVMGAAREQLVVSGLSLNSLSIGSRLYINSCELEIVSLKTMCPGFFRFLLPLTVPIRDILQDIKESPLIPNCGVFAKIINPGTISVNDTLTAFTPAASQQLQRLPEEILNTRYKWMSFEEFEKIYPANTCKIAKEEIYNDRTTF